MNWIGRLIFVSALALAPLTTGDPANADQPVWREQVQVLFDPDTRSVRRAMVRVVDPFPELNLEFVWDPTKGPGIDPETGAAEGEGRLVWRIRGAASYDPDAAYATFVGTLRNGRPEGRGTIRFRSGEWYEGGWRDGLRDGNGHLRRADGTHYEGAFLAGVPHGVGRHTAPDGTVWEGPFRHGLRDGEGVARLPGGTAFRSVWNDGVEIDSDRPDHLADALVGGLLPAQTGGMADRTAMGIAIDARTTAEQQMSYRDRPSDGVVNIYPAHSDMVDAWNGRAAIAQYGWAWTVGNWDTNQAFVDIAFSSTDGSSLTVDQIWLEVADSTSILKPMMQVEHKLGCVGYRPYFGLINYGWGAVEQATLRFRFVKPGYFLDPDNTPSNGTRYFDVPIAGFSDTTPVNISRALAELGLDTRRLASQRFTCSSPDLYDWDYCMAEYLRQSDMGALTPFLGISERSVITEIDGELQFAWRGPDGKLKSARQRLSSLVSVAMIENIGLAEMGDAWDEGANAATHIEVRFPLDRSAYSIPLNYRGRRSGSQFQVQLKMKAPITSIHNFRAAVRFSDGSVRYSQPVRFFYMQPRTDVDFGPLHRLDPQMCYGTEY